MPRYWNRYAEAARGAVLVAALAATIAIVPRPALADGDQIEVFPTGDPGEDIGNIQDAVAMVAEGGTVLLRATNVEGTPTAFNFGQIFPDTLQEAFDARDQNSVNIAKSLTIRGEHLDDVWHEDEEGDEVGNARTTIFGGFEPIRVVAPEIDVTIEKINFDCTRYKVIQVLAGGRVVIRNNRFGKVTFFETDDVFGWPRTFGVAVASDSGFDLVSLRSVLMEKNEVDLNPGTPCPGLEDDPNQDELGDKLAFGLFAANVDATVVFQHNNVGNTARTGINMADSRGLTIIRENVVKTGPRTFTAPFNFGGTGINSGSGFLSQEGERGLTIISRNYVTCENKNCIGIAVGDTTRRGRAIIVGNQVSMTALETPDLVFAAGFDVFIGNSLFAFNRIAGQSNFAILLEGDIGTGVGDLANNNRIFGNNVRNFTPLSTDYFGTMLPEPVDYGLFSANDNRVAGRSGKVFDFGQGNVIRGGLHVVN